jgi:hypothetical protein
MTTLTATPAASATPAAVGNPPASTQRVPDATARRADTARDVPVDLHVSGSGGTTSAAADAARGMTAIGADQGRVVVPLDAFAKQGGPDVSIKTEAGVVSAHAVFQMDARTRELTVAVVDQDGNLIRMIPAESVARMITAMAAYRGR